MPEWTPQTLESDLVRLGHKRATTKARAYLLEKELKGVFAQEYLAGRSEGLSQGDAEQHAYTTSVYKQAVQDASEALQEAEDARVAHDARMARFEAWRTLNASRREQMRQGFYADAE